MTLLREARKRSWNDGADILDVGGVKAGPGPEVTEAEELDRVVPAIAAAPREIRRPALGRHLEGVGRPRGVPCGCGARKRHKRVRGPRLPAGRGRGRSVGRGDPHPPRPESA